MITQIEIDGFKTFKDFKVELAPFQIIVGPNGSGKSNLFDALHLLSRLAEKDIYTAFQELRGDAGELFTKYPDGTTSDSIKVAIEMLVNRKAHDDLGRDFELKHRRLRYELEIALHSDEDELDQLYIKSESLKSLPQQSDNWYKKYYPHMYDNQPLEVSILERVGYSLTQGTSNLAHLTVHHNPPLHLYHNFTKEIDTDSLDIFDEFLPIQLSSLNQTILTSNIVATDHIVIATKAELRSLRFLHLNPQALRTPSSMKAPRTLASDGSNLPATLARMQAEDKHIIGDISREMARLVPGILKIRVERDKLTDRYAIQAQTTDQRTFSSQVLSDGTLRLLALLTLKYDPQFQGVLCLEEPENGVDPLHLSNMASLLRSMATDFSDPEEAEMPLCQLLITTHSPTLVSMPEAINALLFTMKVTHIDPGKNALQITRMVPVSTTDSEQEQTEDIAVESYTINQVLKYLNNRFLDEAKDRLTKKRSRLHKR